jgi:hypothetical protein
VDFVDQFRRLARLLFKWALIAVVVVAGLTGATAAGLYGYEWWAYDRHKANVHVAIFTDDKNCNADFPLAIVIHNGSARTIEKTDLYLKARRPNRSTDLTGSGSYLSDQIIKANEVWAQCWSANLKEEAKGEDPRKLDWSVSWVSVTFAD